MQYVNDRPLSVCGIRPHERRSRNDDIAGRQSPGVRQCRPIGYLNVLTINSAYTNNAMVVVVTALVLSRLRWIINGITTSENAQNPTERIAELRSCAAA
jgi:hypothetical protein